MNPKQTPLSDRAAAQRRAYLKAAAALGLQIGHMTAKQAIDYIISSGNGTAVSMKARQMFPQVF